MSTHEREGDGQFAGHGRSFRAGVEAAAPNVSYPESVEYLYALGNELKPGAKFGLERMQTLLTALGNPERGQRFVHVAGTNGKGSTAAMIASMLRENGLRTGLYTSPHLIEPTERIRIDDRDISKTDFASCFDRVHAAAEQLLEEGRIEAHPSYFETVTAMALLLFRESTDVSVIEVGLGGRLDATNVIKPRLTVITPVSYDHEAYLGNRLESIAGEKAGILKAGVPLVMARQDAAAEQVILARAGELGCEVIRASNSITSIVKASANGSRFELDYETFNCPLAGRHQIENASVAVLACRRLGVAPRAIEVGLEQTKWPGRLEYVSGKPDVILDGAHNPAGAAALAAYIGEFWRDRPVWIIYGAMRDKAIEEVAAQLFPLATRLILTAPDFPRALRPEMILETAGVQTTNATITATLPEALSLMREAPRHAGVFITGSLYLVGEARKLLCAQRAPAS